MPIKATKELKASIEVDTGIAKSNLLDFTNRAMKEYGDETIKRRVLPDFRDGLKPVQRRVLWSMDRMGLNNKGGFAKCARIVGDVMGKFHPHGDQSIYSALVNMTEDNQRNNLIQGNSSFGWIEGKAADMRYTESRLSKLSDMILFGRDYLPVIDMIPNYDGEHTEPLALPSVVPNVLLNGNSGIAVATTVRIPPFEMDGVLTLTEKVLQGQVIGPKACMKYLRFNYPWGTSCATEDEDLLAFYKDGYGNIYFGVEYTLDADKRIMTIHTLTPNWSTENVNKKLEKIPEVERFDNMSEGDKIAFEIKFRKSVPIKSIKALAEKIEAALIVGLSMRINVIDQRKDVYTDPKTGRVEYRDPIVEAKEVNIPTLLKMWCEWRIALELLALKYKLKGYEYDLHVLKILLLASSKLDIIFKVLKMKTDDLDEVLAKKLKIKVEDAKIILDRPVRSLSRLSADKLKADIKEMEAKIAQVKKWIKKPSDKVLADIREIRAVLCPGKAKAKAVANPKSKPKSKSRDIPFPHRRAA